MPLNSPANLERFPSRPSLFCTPVKSLALYLGLIFFLLAGMWLPFASISAERQPLRFERILSRPTRLLIFSPHPDDGILGAGGLIQRVLHRNGIVKVVYMTSGDGYPEGVRSKEHIAQPTEQDYRAYGALRQDEALQALAAVGVPQQNALFLGFPDRGLCPILRKYPADQPPYYRSPYTQEDSPPSADVLLPDTEYDGEDLKREITHVLEDFRPTLIVLPHPLDQHPDHCATYFFVRQAARALDGKDPKMNPLFLTFLIHFGQWPSTVGADGRESLSPPPDFPLQDTAWLSLSLSPAETNLKRTALLYYQSQMLVMESYLLRFIRPNELFLPDTVVQESDNQQQCCGQ